MVKSEKYITKIFRYARVSVILLPMRQNNSEKRINERKSWSEIKQEKYTDETTKEKLRMKKKELDSTH